eukprot:TRINITY_DN7371_c0_g1_i1.p1 TRINITY_DN7371_c0_g1~~TRINITY_DN7371_c0_g1_i1.p1  ORF type:complete len:316 (-),score=72.34 TRINITY_DN7371_c0_g1_i1:174-1064(-)
MSDENLSFEEFKLKYPRQFLPDDQLADTFFFKLVYWFFWTCYLPIWGTKFRGLEHLESLKNKGWLGVTMHSTHNGEVVHVALGFYAFLGKLGRPFMHRAIYNVCPPVFSRAGMLPAHRHHASEVLKAGYHSGVMPGGVEEAMTGHENAYKLHPMWKKRRGWIAIAREAKVPFVPFFIQNVEEMRFNIVIYVLNRLGLTRTWDRIVKSQMLPNNVVRVLKSVFMWIWVLTCVTIAISIPVQVTVHIGKPIYIDWDKTVDEEVAEIVSRQMQDMIDHHQPYGHQYLPGLRSRWNQIWA